jgi:hypothetical protein
MSTTYLPNNVYNIDGYDFFVQDSGASYAIQAIGTNTIQFQVQPGDVWSGDAAGRYRSELASTQQIVNGAPIHVSYVMNVAPGSVNSASWTTLGQFHQNDYDGAPPLSPPFAIGMDGQKMTVSIGYTGANGQPVYLTLFRDANDIVDGQDYAIDISVTFSPSGAGRLVMTRNGATIVDYTGPIGYSTQSSVYWKEGVYEASDATTTMTVDYSNLSLTTSAATTAQTFNGVQSWNSYDGAGNLLSTTTNQIDSSGNLTSSVVQYASGAWTVSTYLIQGQAYVTEVATYNASGALVGLVERHADGSLAYDMQVSNGVTTATTYDGSGIIASVDVIQADGSHGLNIYASDGKTAVESEMFNPSGNLIQDIVYHSDGSKTISQYLITGQAYTSSTVELNAAGVVVSIANYYANGLLQYQKFIDAAGATQTKTYGSAGALLNWSTVNPDGSRSLSVYAGVTGTNPIQNYTAWNAAGAVTLYETFNAAGAPAWKTTFNADASKEIDQYLISGQAYTASVTLYNSAGTITSLTQYYSSGGIYYQNFIDAIGATEAKNYSSAGLLQRWSITYTDGARQVSTYDSTGALAAINKYNSSGALTYNKSVNADGSFFVYQYLITGQPYTSETTAYNSNGVIVSDVKYGSNGVTTKTGYNSAGVVASIATVQADGSSAVNIYAPDGVTVVESATYNTSGGLTQDIAFHSDGSKTIKRFLITGQAYTSSTVEFNAAGVVASIANYYANGLLQYQKFIDAAGATQTKTFSSAGALLNWSTVNPDGSRGLSVYAGVTGTNPIQNYTAWSAAGAVTLYETFNSSGALAWKTIYNADGSKEVDQYLISGQPYTSLATIYNAAGVATSLTQYYNGGAIYSQKLIYATGATETKTYNSAGALQSWLVVNADGSKELDQYLISGQAYTSSATIYNASGVTTSLTQYYSGGGIYYQNFIDAAGATEAKNYTSAGQLQRWSIAYTDGARQVSTYDATGALATINNYNSSGALTYNKTVNADGSSYVYKYLITGQPYVSEASAYSASGVLISDSKYIAGGALYSSYSLSATGVQTTNSYTGGVLTETVQVMPGGATTDSLYSANLVANAIAGPETFVSYHNDTFVFGPNIGADVIKGFNAGAVANQDMIDIATALAPDYAHLQMAQSSSDTVINFGPGQSITLAGVAVSSLSANNFAFF